MKHLRIAHVNPHLGLGFSVLLEPACLKSTPKWLNDIAHINDFQLLDAEAQWHDVGFLSYSWRSLMGGKCKAKFLIKLNRRS